MVTSKAPFEVRATLVDEEILSRTGNEVKLRPIELDELSITVKAL